MGKTIAPKLEEGKSYKMRSTASHMPTKIHVDKVIQNPYYEPHDDWIKNSEDLIVYRVWSRRRKCFKWYVQPFWELCISNDWKLKRDE